MSRPRCPRTLLCGLLAAALALVLAGCGGDPAAGTSGHVDVDTPALRALKHSAGIAPCPRTSAPAAKDGLPEVTLPCLGGGRPVQMAQLRGPMVINLWAQWCGPCREELPYYQSFSQKYAGRVAVLGVDWMDTQPGRALELAKQTGVTYPLVADVDRHIRATSNALPNLILLDSSGHVVHQEAVQIHSVAQLERIVGAHLDVPAAS